jgi:hypothetical protein
MYEHSNGYAAARGLETYVAPYDCVDFDNVRVPLTLDLPLRREGLWPKI